MSKVIVVGAGHWGSNLIRNFHKLGVLEAVVELSAELRQKVATGYPDVRLYSDYGEALTGTEGGVVIATPAPSHYGLGLQALKAGKDVYIEKPMTLDSEEARILARYADENEQVLMVGHLLLYQPAIKWIREYLASGEAGKVLHVATQRAKLGKVRSQENVWWSFAPHDVSVVLSLLANPPLARVQAFGQRILQPNIEDNIHVDLAFEGGQTAHLHASWLWPILQRSTTVITEKQMIVYDEVPQTVTVYDKTVDGNLVNQDNGSRVIDVANEEPLQLECQHFLDCIASRQKPLSDGWNGVAVVEILEKAQESLNG